MEAKKKKMQAYELLLEVAAIPLAERAQTMIGAGRFFDQGWPINHFTVGMAARAGMGTIPPVYRGLGSEGRYFQAMRIRTQPAESVCQPTTPDAVAPDTNTAGSGDKGVESPCGIDTSDTEA